MLNSNTNNNNIFIRCSVEVMLQEHPLKQVIAKVEVDPHIMLC